MGVYHASGDRLHHCATGIWQISGTSVSRNNCYSQQIRIYKENSLQFRNPDSRYLSNISSHFGYGVDTKEVVISSQ